jgi:hypothetical protein
MFASFCFQVVLISDGSAHSPEDTSSAGAGGDFSLVRLSLEWCGDGVNVRLAVVPESEPVKKVWHTRYFFSYSSEQFWCFID